MSSTADAYDAPAAAKSQRPRSPAAAAATRASVPWMTKQTLAARAPTSIRRFCGGRSNGHRPRRCRKLGAMLPYRLAAAAALRSQDRAAGSGEEPCFDEQRHDLRLHDRLAVEALDGEPLAAAAAHVLHERLDRGPQPFLVRL